MDNLPNKKYYTVEDLAKYFNVSVEYIEEFVKDGTIKTINKGKKYVLIPRKDFEKNTREYLEYILRSFIDKKTEIKRGKTDDIRAGLVTIIITIIVPLLVLMAYIKIVGFDYATSETGGLISIGLIIVSVFIVYLGYKILFSKYSDDLPEKFF